MSGEENLFCRMPIDSASSGGFLMVAFPNNKTKAKNRLQKSCMNSVCQHILLFFFFVALARWAESKEAASRSAAHGEGWMKKKQKKGKACVEDDEKEEV